MTRKLAFGNLRKYYCVAMTTQKSKKIRLRNFSLLFKKNRTLLFISVRAHCGNL